MPFILAISALRLSWLLGSKWAPAMPGTSMSSHRSLRQLDPGASLSLCSLCSQEEAFPHCYGPAVPLICTAALHKAATS